jgi:hypothetical protein
LVLLAKQQQQKNVIFIYDLSVLLVFKNKMCILREYKDTFFFNQKPTTKTLFKTSLRPFDGCYFQNHLAMVSYYVNAPLVKQKFDLVQDGLQTTKTTLHSIQHHATVPFI